MRTLWSYEKSSKAIKDSEDRLVMHIDDVNEDVVGEVVKMWNLNKDLKLVQSYLNRSNLCTSEETEYLMEQIGNYEKSLKDVSEGDQIAENIKIGVETLVPEPGPKVEKSLQDRLVDHVNSNPTKKRQPRNTTVVKSSGKAMSAVEIVERLKEQILCIEYLNGISVDGDGFPANIGKAAREVLIGFQKEIETTKNLAITAIQQL